ncbi:MAG: protein-glutamate O-methyltransferase CheR, partial [Pseudomonadota bacterium]
ATINTSSTDYILEPHEMPVAISNYIMRRGSDDGAFEDALLHDPAGVTHLLLSLSDANPDWQVQFAGYKRPMVCRRIAKRMMLTNQSTLDRYAALVASDANEAGHLASELLVSVTEFFRDPEAWRVLAEQVIPNIIHDDGPEAKIWSAGCCTGEEAYSLAMLCDEYCRANNISRNFRVVATDLDSAALEQASRGVYPVSIEECISPERLKKYFSRTGRGYEVSTKLRSKVLFSRHDLIDSPPFVYVDLLVCRNVLIYLNRDIQDRLLDNFGFSLRRDGFLFLGPSESLGTRSGSFSAVERIHRIFRNRKIPITKAMSQVSKFPSVRSYQLPAATRLGRRSLQAAQSRA